MVEMWCGKSRVPQRYTVVVLEQPPTLQKTRTTRQSTKNSVPGLAKTSVPKVVAQTAQMSVPVIRTTLGVIRIASFEMTGGRTNAMTS